MWKGAGRDPVGSISGGSVQFWSFCREIVLLCAEANSKNFVFETYEYVGTVRLYIPKLLNLLICVLSTFVPILRCLYKTLRSFINFIKLNKK